MIFHTFRQVYNCIKSNKKRGSFSLDTLSAIQIDRNVYTNGLHEMGVELSFAEMTGLDKNYENFNKAEA